MLGPYQERHQERGRKMQLLLTAIAPLRYLKQCSAPGFYTHGLTDVESFCNIEWTVHLVTACSSGDLVMTLTVVAWVNCRNPCLYQARQRKVQTQRRFCLQTRCALSSARRSAAFMQISQADKAHSGHHHPGTSCCQPCTTACRSAQTVRTQSNYLSTS